MTFKPFLSPAIALLTIPVLFGCGSDERITGVSPAANDVEAGPGGEEDDDIFTPAADDDAVGDDDTSPTVTGRPNTPPPAQPPAMTSNIGLPCEGNAQCGAGLECLQADSDAIFGGGPANGMCTVSCAGDFDCQAVDSNAFCMPVSETEGVCVLGCTPGDTLLGQTKCLGRPDLACASLSGYGFCLPMCGSDADCPDGRVCDVGAGTCLDAPVPGDPIGTECDAEAEENNCSSGFCLALSEEYAACSGFCVTGTIGCGSGNVMPEDPGEPICLALFEGVGLQGDLGQCIQRCNCDLDCLHPDAKCFAPFDTDEEAMAAFGSIGICINGDVTEDPEAADLRVGIECEDGREPPLMSEAGVDSGTGGMSSVDSGPVTPLDSGSEPAPVDASPVAPATDAASADGG